MGLYQCCQAPSYHPETQEKTAPLVYYLWHSWVGGDGEWRKENKLRTPVAAWGTVHHFIPFIRNFAKLSVMENEEDGDPCNWLPGLGKPNEYGDGHSSCAQ